ncbi:MAG: hypothetical protein ABI615_06560 [Chthoniobacterales bacterium]
MLKNRNTHFYGITLVYVIFGLCCLYFKNGNPAATHDFLLHGSLTVGISFLYLLIAWLTLRYYDLQMQEYVRRLPQTLDEITARASAQGIAESETQAHAKVIRKSTGYSRILGLQIPVYTEIRFLRDFGRLVAALAFILVLNLGWNEPEGWSLPLLTIVAASFLWISSSRYQKELDFIQSTTPLS